jgi:hypothetical protein
MAKAGLGKGNAFAPSGGHSAQHVAIVRDVARQQAAANMPPVDQMMREAKIKALADVIEDASVRKRVKTEMGIGLIRARGGHEPLAKISGCDGCKRPGHGTHQFLCLEKMKFKTSVEKKVFEKVRQPLLEYAAERRQELGKEEQPPVAPLPQIHIFGAWAASGSLAADADERPAPERATAERATAERAGSVRHPPLPPLPSLARGCGLCSLAGCGLA